MKKRRFEEPEVKVIVFGSEDIITTSPGNDYDPWEEDIF